MEGVLNYTLSTVLIGFLEQGFISLMAIRILKAFDSLQIDRFKKLLLIVAPAVLLNLPELLGLNPYVSLVFEMFVMAAFIHLVTKRKPVFVFLAVLGSMMFFVATEGVFGYSVMAAAGLTSEDFIGNAPLAFLASLPERVIQYLILYFISVGDIKRLIQPKRRKINIFSIIKASKSYRIYAGAVLLIIVLYMGMFIKLFAVNGVLHSIHPVYAILTSVLIICTPFVVLLIFIESLYKSHSMSDEYVRFLVGSIKGNALKVYENAKESGSQETIESAENLLKTLDLTDD